MKALTKKQIWTARLIAMIADAVQIFLFPLFSEGYISPLEDALDIGVCIVLTIMVGWHWSFLPSAFAKLVPVLDEAPSWTLAVFYATRTRLLPPPHSNHEKGTF